MARGRFLAGIEHRSSQEIRPARPGEVRVYRPGEKIVETPWEGPGIGMMVRGLITGDWRGAGELRTMMEGTGSAGG